MTNSNSSFRIINCSLDNVLDFFEWIYVPVDYRVINCDIIVDKPGEPSQPLVVMDNASAKEVEEFAIEKVRIVDPDQNLRNQFSLNGYKIEASNFNLVDKSGNILVSGTEHEIYDKTWEFIKTEGYLARFQDSLVTPKNFTMDECNQPKNCTEAKLFDACVNWFCSVGFLLVLSCLIFLAWGAH